MIRGKWADTPQFLKHGTINALGFAKTRTAMHDAIADGTDGTDASSFLQQLNQQWNAGNVVGRINPALLARVRENVRERQPGVRQTDAVKLAHHNLCDRFAHSEERESKARRTAIDGQDGLH